MLLRAPGAASQTSGTSADGAHGSGAALRCSQAVDVRHFAGPELALSTDGNLLAAAVIDPAKPLPPSADIDYDTSRPLYQSESGVPFGLLRSDVWVWRSGVREPLRVASPRASSWAPTWSPSGRWLAFLSDRSGEVRVWVWDRRRNRVRQASTSVPYGYGRMVAVRWTKDERHLVVSILPASVSLRDVKQRTERMLAADGGEARVTTTSPRVLMWPAPNAAGDRWDGASWAITQGYSTDIALIDWRTGQVDRVFSGRRVLSYALSPDSRFVLFTEPVDSGYPETSKLFVAPLRGSPTFVDTILQGESGVAVSWSPDGTRLVYLARSSDGRDEARLYSVADGARLHAMHAWSAPLARPVQRPLWNGSGTEVYWVGVHELWRLAANSGDLSLVARMPAHTISGLVPLASSDRLWSPDSGRTLVLAVRNDTSQASGLVRVDLIENSLSRGPERAVAFAGSVGGNTELPAVAGPNGNLYLLLEATDKSPEIWAGDSTLTSLRPHSRLNADLERLAMGSGLVVRWRDLDGITRAGALLLPSGYVPGRRYPLIVSVYPGATASTGANRYAATGGYGFLAYENLQLFATRGFAVLVPDSKVRGERLSRDIASTVLTGINRVIDLGIADSSRLGVMGHSLGGSATIELLLDTPRFRAAVDYAGPIDFGGLFGAFDVVGAGTSMATSTETFLGATPWSDPLRYMASSPLYRLDRLTTPLLILQGSLDRQSPQAQSSALFVGLRRLGREVTYVTYPDEAHVVARRRNTIDLCERLTAWFQTHLASGG